MHTTRTITQLHNYVEKYEYMLQKYEYIVVVDVIAVDETRTWSPVALQHYVMNDNEHCN